MPIGQTTREERAEALRDFAFALEVICSRIPADERYLSGHEATAYQALVKWPQYVKSRHVRRLIEMDSENPKEKSKDS